MQTALKELSRATLAQAEFKNTESITTTKTLTDDDYVFQLLSAPSGNQTVKLPAIGNENHPFVIQHVGTINTISIKDNAGTATIVDLGANDYVMLVQLNGVWKYFKTGYDPYFNIQIVIGDGISPISPGIKGDVEVPYSAQIIGWTVLEATGTAGSIQIDVWRDIYDNFPPTVGDSITGMDKPILSGAVRNQKLNVTLWTSANLNRGDILRINVDSASAVKQVTFCLKCKRV